MAPLNIKPQYPLDQEAELAKRCLDWAPFLVYCCDRQGRMVEGNQAACEGLGYTPAELLERTVFDIDPGISRDDWAVLWQRLLEGRTTNYETIHCRKDASRFPVAVTTALIEFDSQQMAIIYVKEISEHRRIEQELSLTRFSIDKAPVGIFRSDSDGRILDVNETACKQLGYSREKLCQMHITDINPTLTADMCNILWEKMCTRGTIHIDTLHQRKDGTTFPVNVTCNPFAYEGTLYAIATARDLTEKKEAREKREIVEDRLRQAQRMESLGTLASGVAHDFNNILSAIYGYAELAQLRCSAHSKLRGYIDQICTASIRAKNLIKQIQTFSRQGESKKQNIDISFVILETLKLIRATLPSTIEMKQNIQSGLGDVFADDTHIHQMVMNLCTNAYHAMQANGGLLEVNLERVTIGAFDSQAYPVISPGKYLKLTVSDTGTGIPPGNLSRIFEPYFSTKPSGEGTGMGLSTVIGMLEDHGGSIKVDSLQGVGSVFQVFLPLVETSADQRREDPGTVSILLVDDETLLLSVGKEYLEDMGYSVEIADNPIDAIKAVQSNPEKFDLIITDLTMPQMTGETLAGEIKKVLPEIPIIMCTGFDSSNYADRLKALGIERLLTKPLNLIELNDTIRKLTGYRSTRSRPFP